MPKYKITFSTTEYKDVIIDAPTIDEAKSLFHEAPGRFSNIAETTDFDPEYKVSLISLVPVEPEPSADPTEALKTFIEGLGKAVEDGLKEISAAVRDAIKEGGK